MKPASLPLRPIHVSVVLLAGMPLTAGARLFQYLLCIACFGVSAASAATVAVIPGPPETTPAVVDASGAPVMNGRFRLGYFVGFDDSLAYRDQLLAPGSGVNSFIAANFIPLGEPAAPIFSVLGGGTPQLGDSSTVNQSVLSGGLLGVGGGITGGGVFLTFVPGTPNTYTSAGLPRGSRLFLVVYPTTDISDASQAGIYSATSWVVPTSTVVTVATLPMIQLDTAGEVYRGSFGSFGPQNALVLPVVPEPSSFVLLLTGAMFFARRRRR